MTDLVSLNVEDTGSGDPVLLLHSTGMSGRQWRRLAQSLVTRGRRAIVPDLTGHGASPFWPEPRCFSHRTDVAHVSALLATLDAPAHVVGHSYGGLLALLAMLESPSRVRSLVLYDPVAFGVLDPERDAEALRELDRVPRSRDGTAEGHERWLKDFVEYWGGEGAWEALREEVRAEFRRIGWIVYAGVSSLTKDPTPQSAYRGSSVPLLLLSGEKTPLSARRVAVRLAEAFANARIVTVPGAGHMGPMTHADLVNEMILSAL